MSISRNTLQINHLHYFVTFFQGNNGGSVTLFQGKDVTLPTLFQGDQ